MKVAIVGGGWAGLAAAVEAVRAGHAVTLFEAARTLGGRARALPLVPAAGGQAAATVDNGQHILIGAYVQTLRLMRLVGVDPERALLRMPLRLTFPDGSGLRLPDWPAPLDVLAGIAGARGWSWRDRLSLLRCAAAWQRGGFRCQPAATVADLCTTLTPRVRSGLVDLLCVAALNTPAERSSGQVFLRVLQDALFGPRGSSHLLLPRTDLGALFPEAAAQWLRRHHARVRTGHRVDALQAAGTGGWRIGDESFDQAVLACPPWQALSLAEASGRAAPEWLARTRALEHTAIATVYAQSGAGLPQALLALHSGPGAPAQFVFDRGRLGGPPGLLAFVASASAGTRDALQDQVLAQGRRQLGLGRLQAVQTVQEKRATFACTPGLLRPALRVGPALTACGDYIDGPYPATLEGAVRSGIEAAAALTGP